MNNFRAGSSIGYGWETFKKRGWFFVGVSVLICIAYGIGAGITGGIDHVVSGIGTITNMLLGAFIGMGVIAFFLKAHDVPETVESSDLWHPEPFLKYLGATLLSGGVIIVGLILLIVPGIIFSMMFIFTPYIVIDKGLGPVEAMKESARITKGHRWALLGFSFLCALVMILGFICLIVGMLVAMPVIYLATAHAYRTLEKQAQAMPAPVPMPAPAA